VPPAGPKGERKGLTIGLMPAKEKRGVSSSIKKKANDRGKKKKACHKVHLTKRRRCGAVKKKKKKKKQKKNTKKKKKKKRGGSLEVKLFRCNGEGDVAGPLRSFNLKGRGKRRRGGKRGRVKSRTRIKGKDFLNLRCHNHSDV